MVYIMKKKILFVATFALSILSSCFASDTLRVGLSFGAATHAAKSSNEKTGDRDTYIKSAPSAGVFVGYDHLINETPLFLGVEVAGHNHNSETTKDGLHWPHHTPYTLTLKTNNTISGAIRFGVVAKEAMLYAKVGAATTNWQVAVKTKGRDDRTTYQKMGYVGGIGIESRLNENFSMGVEHECVFSNNLKNMRPNIFVKISPLVQTTSFRLVYNF